MAEPVLSVIIPDCKSPEQTKISLRLLRKYTDLSKIRIFVSDCGSDRAVSDYLRKLPWIKLIESEPANRTGETGSSAGLDEAVSAVDTPFVMFMHSDTFVLRSDWPDYLLGHFDSNRCAGAGCAESVIPASLTERFMCKVKMLCSMLSGKKNSDRERYLQNYCAVYRTDLLKQYCRGSYDGKNIRKKLEAAGFELIFLPPDELCSFICHPEVSDADSRSCRCPDKKILKNKSFRQILDSGDLDL